MKPQNANLAKLTHHVDELTPAVRAFHRDCRRMVDAGCLCLFCADLGDALQAADELLESLRHAVDSERAEVDDPTDE